MQRIWGTKQEESSSPLSCHDRTHRSCHREESVIANQHDVEDRRGAEQVINYQPEFAEASPEDPSPRQHIGHVQGNAEGTCNQRGPFPLRCRTLHGGCVCVCVPTTHHKPPRGTRRRRVGSFPPPRGRRSVLPGFGERVSGGRTDPRTDGPTDGRSPAQPGRRQESAAKFALRGRARASSRRSLNPASGLHFTY